MLMIIRKRERQMSCDHAQNKKLTLLLFLKCSAIFAIFITMAFIFSFVSIFRETPMINDDKIQNFVYFDPENNRKLQENDLKPNNLQIQAQKKQNNSFPKIIWRMPEANALQNTQFERYISTNIRYFASKSHFKFVNLRDDCYGGLRDHLNRQTNYRIYQRLQQQYLKITPSLSKILEGYLIKLYTLYQKGGVWIENNVILYEDLSWMQSLDSNPHVVNRMKNTPPQVFTYYLEENAPYPIRGDPNNVGEYYPHAPIRDYLIACKPNSKFIKDWINQFLILEHYYSKDMPIRQTAEKLRQLYYQAAKNIMRITEQSLRVKDSLQHASHFYGLRQMNSIFFGQKLFFFSNKNTQKQVSIMTEISEDNFKYNSGPLRYSEEIPVHVIANFLRESLSNYSKILIDEKSIFSKYILMNDSHLYALKKNFTELQIEEDKAKLNAMKFEFPKIVWVYWETGQDSLDTFHKMCLNNIKYFSEKGGYEVRFVSAQNLYTYLSNQTMKKVNQTLQSRKSLWRPTTKSDLVRAALLYEIGGIYVDLTVMLSQDFKWIEEIAQNQFAIGKNSSKPPEAFFWIGGSDFFRPFQKDPNQLHTYYKFPILENQFIVAKPKSLLFTELFNLFCTFKQNGWAYINEFITQNKIQHNQRWKTQYFTQYLAFESIIQLRQRKLDAQGKGELAINYYGIYALDVRAGPYHIHHNVFYYGTNVKTVKWLAQEEIEFAEERFGKFRYMSKFNHYIANEMRKELELIVSERRKTAKGTMFEKYMLMLPENKKLIKYDWL